MTYSESAGLTIFKLGSVEARASRRLRVYFHVKNVGTAASPAVDPALKKAGAGCLHETPRREAGSRAGSSAVQRTFRGGQASSHAAGAGYAAITQPVPIGDPAGPRFALYRGQPYAVEEEGDYAYTIAFTNLGQKAATNIVLAMQVPYGVTLPGGGRKGLTQSMRREAYLTANPLGYTTTDRTDAKNHQGQRRRS